ncbi:predicted protein [Firmicutes bacterium CAG:884]|nr:predicted protein [Firmicutes bacterium CAG:884]
MKKKVLVFSILCLLFITINYTYSSFQNTIVGNISATSNNWRFAVNVTNGIKENDYFKVPIGGTSGSFSVTLNTTNSSNNVKYSIELSGYNLPSDIKYYKDSSYSTLISNNLYSDTINKNTSKTITIYYKSSSTISGYVYVKVKGNVSAGSTLAMMKNGISYNGSDYTTTSFWRYRTSIYSIKFTNNFGSKPSNCNESNKCWDISYEDNQTNKVYAWMYTNGTDSNGNTRYNLMIASTEKIYFPYDASNMFRGFTQLNDITFSTDVDTSLTTNMSDLFRDDKALSTLDVSKLDTSNVKNLSYVFYNCSSLKTIDLSNFNTSKATTLAYLFYGCSLLSAIDVSKFDTSNTTDIGAMFYNCSKITSLSLSNFNTSKVTNMYGLFNGCSSLTSLDLSKFDTSNVGFMGSMFERCTSLTTLDLSKFKTTKLKSVFSMFSGCTKLKTLNISNFDFSSVLYTQMMFSNCSSLTTTLNFNATSNTSVSNYSQMFYAAATASGAKITVNYKSSSSTLVDNMIATKSYNSNVVKGSIIS